MKIYPIFLLLTLFSCQIFEPKPQSEKFYCKIESKAFRPNNGGDISFEPLLANRDEKYNIFDMLAVSKDGNSISLGQKFNNIKDFKEKEYKVNQEFTVNYYGDLININGSNQHEKYESFENSGYIIFSKIDTINQRVSGTFAFKLKSTHTQKVITITKGQFNDVYFY
jgi:hypothetical protein